MLKKISRIRTSRGLQKLVRLFFTVSESLLLTFLDDQATDEHPFSSRPTARNGRTEGYDIHHINDPNSLASPAGGPGGQEGSRGGRSE